MTIVVTVTTIKTAVAGPLLGVPSWHQHTGERPHTRSSKKRGTKDWLWLIALWNGWTDRQTDENLLNPFPIEEARHLLCHCRCEDAKSFGSWRTANRKAPNAKDSTGSKPSAIRSTTTMTGTTTTNRLLLSLLHRSTKHTHQTHTFTPLLALFHTCTTSLQFTYSFLLPQPTTIVIIIIVPSNPAMPYHVHQGNDQKERLGKEPKEATSKQDHSLSFLHPTLIHNQPSRRYISSQQQQYQHSSTIPHMPQ